MSARSRNISRRGFLSRTAWSTAALPFVTGLRGFAAEGAADAPRQRLIIMFSPNGTLPDKFWPDEEGEQFKLKELLQPLSSFQDRMLLLRGLSNRIRGDGDGHMRGMSCLLTAIELFPGNIQGGSDTPAGWASGISIDQELKNFLQSREATRTRLGSLELGVVVPDRADPWTRMVYAGPNQPVAPISDPYQVFAKLYGRVEDRDNLRSVLDDVAEELGTLHGLAGAEDRRLLEQHTTYVRELERRLAAPEQVVERPLDPPPGGLRVDNDQMPELTRLQTDLLVNCFANDMARIATLQFTNSVGQARMKWLGIEEGHHSLSHDPDLNAESQEKLTKINVWFAEQLCYLLEQLAATPEPGREGSLLDHTTVIWTNELGKGNSHTLDNIPFLLVGGGLGFRTGRSLNFGKTPHNRLWLSIAHAFGHELETFGNPRLSEGGPLEGLKS